MFVSVPESWLTPDNLSLPSKEELHIWFIDLDKSKLDFNYEFNNLSQLDKKKLNDISNDLKRELSIKRHIILLKILSYYLKKNFSDIELKYNEYGKPYLDTEEIKFNISNSYNFLLIGITTEIEIGVDIEKFRSNERFEKLVERYFTEKEKEFYNSLPDHKQEIFFFDLWTLKEAVVKTLGWGMRLPFHSFEFPFEDNQNTIQIQYKSINQKLYAYKCLVSNDTSITVCLERRVDTIKYFRP